MKEDKEQHNEDAAANEPRLHTSNFTPSESRTTNIPPRLPVGFSYDSPASAAPEATNAETAEADVADTADTAATTAVTANVVSEVVPVSELHPDMPADEATLRTEDVMTARRKQPRRKRTNHTARRMGAWCKRYALWLLLVVLVTGAAATYKLWTPILGGWEHNEEPAPVIAADTLPKTKPQVADTVVNMLTHEDSMRIQDSVRHARWLYWQRYKQRQQQKADAQTAEAEEADAPTSESAVPVSGTHPTTHAAHNDSLH